MKPFLNKRVLAYFIKAFTTSINIFRASPHNIDQVIASIYYSRERLSLSINYTEDEYFL